MTRTPESIRAEAQHVRAEAQQLQAELGADPENVRLRRRMGELKQRYDALQAEFRSAEAAGPELAETPGAGMFDPSQFEVSLERTAGRPVVLNAEDTMVDKILGLLKSSAFWRHSLALLLLLVVGFVLALILRGDVGFYQVPTESMVPTFHPGDNLIAKKESSYERGDVIVVPDPGDTEAFLTKRIVGKGGDTIEVRGGTLYVNGAAIHEPYLREPIDYRLPPLQVPAGEVFLLGDNRNESEDSHLWGRGLPAKDIKGRVFYIYRPSERRGMLEDYRSAFAGLP